jgi:hypothetical protein
MVYRCSTTCSPGCASIFQPSLVVAAQRSGQPALNSVDDS